MGWECGVGMWGGNVGLKCVGWKCGVGMWESECGVGVWDVSEDGSVG